jgi:hypothetical protein
MINFTNLVKEYKETKSKITLNRIYSELKSTVQQKAKFIYYHKYYPLNLYHACKYCRNCNKLRNIPKSEHSIICKECDICKCTKGFFNLKKDNLCELEDVENDIWCEILRIINNFDVTKDFNSYLFSCLWEFIPTFITKNFVKSLLNKSLVHIDEEGNETEIEIPQEENQFKLSTEEIFSVCQDEIDRNILTLMLKNKDINQTEIAKKLKVTKQYISLKLKELQKRLKILLVKTRK